MHKIVLIEGDGIGPEIVHSVENVFQAAKINVCWVKKLAGQVARQSLGTPLPQDTIKAIEQYQVVLKGPLTTSKIEGYGSINVTLRKQFNLYANIRPIKTLPNIPKAQPNIDIVIIRENTQGLYSGIERWVDADHTHAESISVITRPACEKIITMAFEYASKNNYQKVTLVHKANILRFTTGLFLSVGREIAQNYPNIQFEDIIVDNMAMQMVLRPHTFNIIVATNLFGDILSDLGAGLVGGLGVVGSANLGRSFALFEAVHGSAPDIAGKGIANPIAILLSAVMMLEHLNEHESAQRINQAILKTIERKDVCTPDIGGTGTTTSFTEHVCQLLS